MIKKVDLDVAFINDSSGSDTMINYVPSFNIATMSLIRIKQGILKVNATVNSIKEGGFEVYNSKGEVIDCLKDVSSNGCYCIDVSDELNELVNEGNTTLSIRIKNTTNYITINNVEAHIKYDLKSSEKIGVKKEKVHCRRAGNGNVNLLNGNLKFIHQDVIGNKLPIEIKHVYNSLLANKENDNVVYNDGIYSLPNYNCGKGWKLNLEQYLLKETNYSLSDDNETSKIFTYINGEGNHEILLEKYYYLNEVNEKVYVTLGSINIDIEGNLTYQDREVKKEIVSESGLTLVSELEGFKGLELLDKDNEDIAALKEEIKNIEETLKEYNQNIEYINEEIELFDKAKNIKDKNQEILSLNNSVSFITNLNQRSIKSSQKIYNDNYKLYVEQMDSRIYAKAGETDQPTVLEKQYKEVVNSQNEYLTNATYQTIYGNEEDQVLGTSQYLKELDIASEELYNLNSTYNNDEAALGDKKYQDQLTKLNAIIEQYELKLQKKKNELDYLEKKIPVHYLTDGKGNAIGFAKVNEEDKLYRLVLVIDNYGNTIYYNYRNDKLMSIYNEEEDIIEFKYNNESLLEEIIDENNRNITFSYDNGNLINIKYNNDLTSSYEYDVNGLLVKIIDSSWYITNIEYLNNRVINVKEGSYISLINNDGKYEDSNKYLTNCDFSITYYDYKSTMVTNNKNSKIITYLFDDEENVACAYENVINASGPSVDTDINVRAISYDNVASNKRFVIEALNDAEELLFGSSFSNTITSELYLGDDLVCGDDIILTALDSETRYDNSIYLLPSGDTYKLEKIVLEEYLDKIKNSGVKDFVLSGWAKADSAYVNRRATDYSNNLDIVNEEDLLTSNTDEYKRNRRFELRAELTYLNNGITRIEEQYCSFDWMNVNWQYVAFPVTISEDEEDELLEIKVVFDYSNNVNEVLFYGASLKEGKWEYKEYDTNKLLRYYENSQSNSYITYDYDNKNLIKECLYKDNQEYITNYEYNRNNSLIRIITSEGIVIENEYSDKGDILKSYSYHKDNPTSKLYINEKMVDETGLIQGEYNSLGEKVSTYEYKNNLIRSKIDLNGNLEVYGYDYRDDSLISFSKSVNEETCTNEMAYKYDLLTQLEHNDTRYNYEYDGLGRVVKIKINDTDYISNKYEETEMGLMTTTTYNNQETFITTEDKEGNIVRVEYLNKEGESSYLINSSYDRYNRIKEEVDTTNNIKYLYEYDKLNRLINKGYVRNNININLNNEYSEDNTKISNILKLEYLDGEETLELNRVTTYNYDNTVNKRLLSIELPNNIIETISYDKLGRVSNIKVGDLYTKHYEYLQKGDHTTNLISKESYVLNNVVKESVKYKYDEKGNIASIKENEEEVVRYEYDDLNRLVREDNKKLNKTVIFSYDKGGNITNKIIYPYSKEERNKLENGENNIYKYPLSGMKDQLMEYNNEIFKYDSIGNPIIYRNKTLEWDRVRNLVKYDNIATYSYDINGVRLSKTVNGVTTNYYYENNKLLFEDNGNKLYFNYDSTGLEGFTSEVYGEYHYKKNILGDIIGIIDSNNIEIVKYEYDAVGNHKTFILNESEFVDIDIESGYSINVSSNYAVAVMNPFRYRGYYYDVETQLFYCNSRYYSPELCRWISPDSIEYLDTSSINGLNLYCYCYNNPISYYDPSGHSALLIGLLIFTGAMTLGGAIYGGVSAGMAGGDVGDVFAGIGKGALNGLILGGGISLAIGGFAIGGTTILGSIMATYGLSISANMLEVAITQGKKSAYDGDNFWAGANDINNAMFANSGNILIGKPTLMSIPFYGTRMTSKIPTIFNVLVSYDLDKFFGSTTFLASAKATLLSKASPFGLAMGYGLTAWQYYNLIRAIVTTPDFENSRWILY